MSSSTVVATANVLGKLDVEDAVGAVEAVLSLEPDLLGLQEWYRRRRGLLASLADYHWHEPLLGGCAVGALRDRFEPVSHRLRLLSLPGRSDRGDHPLGYEPGRAATVSVFRDRLVPRTICLVDYHLVSGVQRGDRYREDRPRLVARHRHEADVLARTVSRMAADHTVYAVGDSNFHGLRLPGLTSTWEGRSDVGGTLGPRRQIDDVHASVRAATYVLLDTPSDHRALVVTVDDNAPD